MTSSSSSSSSLLFVSSSLTAEAAYDEIVSVANFRELTFDSPRLVTDNLKFASETSSESSSVHSLISYKLSLTFLAGSPFSSKNLVELSSRARWLGNLSKVSRSCGSVSRSPLTSELLSSSSMLTWISPVQTAFSKAIAIPSLLFIDYESILGG